jgi:hypothetical protein
LGYVALVKAQLCAPILERFLSDNIFNEVDEEVRRERLQKLWDRYGLYLIGAAALFVIAVASWNGYQYLQNQKSAKAGSAFEAAAALNDQGKYAEAEKAFDNVAKDGTAGYQTLARFRSAAAAAQRDPKDAVRIYDELTKSNIGPALQDLAAVRAGFLLIDTAPVDEIRSRLEALAEPGRPFRHSARELLALSAWKNGDFASAKRYIDMISNDNETPQGTRSRVEVLAALLAAGGKS